MGAEIIFIINWFFILLIAVCVVFGGIVFVCRTFWFFQDNLIPVLRSKVTIIILILVCIFLFFHYNGVWRYLMERDNISHMVSIIPIIK